MKTLLKSISLLLVLLAFQSHAATVTPTYKIQKIGGKSFVLSFEKAPALEADLRIEDKNGVIVWEEEIGSGHPQVKKYNLEQLPTGSYWLVIEDDLKIETQKVDVKSNTLFIDDLNKKVEYKPVYNLEDRRLTLSFLQLNQAVNIRISDADGHDLLSEEIAPATNLNKAYNLAALPSGRYIIRVYTDESQYRHAFELE